MWDVWRLCCEWIMEERRVPGRWLLPLCGASIQLVALSLCSVSLHCWTAPFTSHPPGNPPCLYLFPQGAPALSACRLGWLWLHYLWIFTPHSPHTYPFEASTAHRESEKYSHHILTSSDITFTPAMCCYSFAHALFRKGVCVWLNC